MQIINQKKRAFIPRLNPWAFPLIFRKVIVTANLRLFCDNCKLKLIFIQIHRQAFDRNIRMYPAFVENTLFKALCV